MTTILIMLQFLLLLRRRPPRRRRRHDGATRREHEVGECDVTVTDYPAGHVIYADPDAHKELALDLRNWMLAR